MIDKLLVVPGMICYWLSLPLLRYKLKHSHRARIMVVHADKLLVVRHFLGDGNWTLPGGGIHGGEAAPLAALRELNEETRIVGNADQLTFLGHGRHHTNGIEYDYECYYMTVHERPKVRIGWPEIIGYRWVGVADIHAVALSEETIFAVQQYANMQQG